MAITCKSVMEIGQKKQNEATDAELASVMKHIFGCESCREKSFKLSEGAVSQMTDEEFRQHDRDVQSIVRRIIENDETREMMDEIFTPKIGNLFYCDLCKNQATFTENDIVRWEATVRAVDKLGISNPENAYLYLCEKCTDVGREFLKVIEGLI